MKRKDISVGPLDDGQIYRYDTASDKWFDDKGPVDLLPYKCPSTNGRTETFYFHTASHKWTNEYGLILPIEKSVNIDYAFRKKCGINGEVGLYTLENSSKRGRRKSEPEEEIPEEDDIPEEKPYSIDDFNAQMFQEDDGSKVRSGRFL